MNPEPLGYAETDMTIAIHAAAFFTEHAVGQMADGSTEKLLVFGIAADNGNPQDPQHAHIRCVIPLEIAATMIAAIRENARRQDMNDALTAAIDRHLMIWKDMT